VAGVANGAQLADLVRLEALIRYGGIYLDQDMQPLRSFEPLLVLTAFAAWEDARTVPNAVLGARRDHPALRECLDLAIARMHLGTWEAGPYVTTKVLTGRDDVLVLPSESFYPVHYRDARAELPDFDARAHPASFAVHHWWGSWLPSEKRWNDAPRELVVA
jgi:mannosyltransferase OCH1-like enzyme